MSLPGRQADQDDFLAALDALVKMKTKSPAPQMKYTNPKVAFRHMMRSDTKARVVAGYFIMYDVGSPWYSEDRFLMEDLIIRIYPTASTVEVAIDALSEIARELGCKAVIAGDTQVGYMAPKYLAKGFVTLGTQLMKEVPNGLAPKGDRRTGPD